MVVSPAIGGTIIASFGTEEQKQRWLPGIADGTARWPSRSPSPTPAPTRTRSPPPPAATATAPPQRHEVLHLRRRRGRGTCWSSRDADDATHRQAQALSLFIVPTDAPGHRRTSRSPWRSCAPEQQFTRLLRRRPASADGLVGTEGAASSSCSPASTPSASWAPPRDGHRPLRAGQGRGVRQGAQGLGRPDRRAPGRSPTRSPSPTSRSSWPG